MCKHRLFYYKACKCSIASPFPVFRCLTSKKCHKVCGENMHIMEPFTMVEGLCSWCKKDRNMKKTEQHKFHCWTCSTGTPAHAKQTSEIAFGLYVDDSTTITAEDWAAFFYGTDDQNCGGVGLCGSAPLWLRLNRKSRWVVLTWHVRVDFDGGTCAIVIMMSTVETSRKFVWTSHEEKGVWLFNLPFNLSMNTFFYIKKITVCFRYIQKILSRDFNQIKLSSIKYFVINYFF